MTSAARNAMEARQKHVDHPQLLPGLNTSVDSTRHASAWVQKRDIRARHLCTPRENNIHHRYGGVAVPSRPARLNAMTLPNTSAESPSESTTKKKHHLNRAQLVAVLQPLHASILRYHKPHRRLRRDRGRRAENGAHVRGDRQHCDQRRYAV
jgi:hypothetical protein